MEWTIWFVVLLAIGATTLIWQEIILIRQQRRKEHDADNGTPVADAEDEA